MEDERLIEATLRKIKERAKHEEVGHCIVVDLLFCLQLSSAGGTQFEQSFNPINFTTIIWHNIVCSVPELQCIWGSLALLSADFG